MYTIWYLIAMKPAYFHEEKVVIYTTSISRNTNECQLKDQLKY